MDQISYLFKGKIDESKHSCTPQFDKSTNNFSVLSIFLLNIHTYERCCFFSLFLAVCQLQSVCSPSLDYSSLFWPRALYRLRSRRPYRDRSRRIHAILRIRNCRRPASSARRGRVPRAIAGRNCSCPFLCRKGIKSREERPIPRRPCAGRKVPLRFQILRVREILLLGFFLPLRPLLLALAATG